MTASQDFVFEKPEPVPLVIHAKSEGVAVPELCIVCSPNTNANVKTAPRSHGHTHRRLTYLHIQCLNKQKTLPHDELEKNYCEHPNSHSLC